MPASRSPGDQHFALCSRSVVLGDERTQNISPYARSSPSAQVPSHPPLSLASRWFQAPWIAARAASTARTFCEVGRVSAHQFHWSGGYCGWVLGGRTTHLHFATSRAGSFSSPVRSAGGGGADALALPTDPPDRGSSPNHRPLGCSNSSHQGGDAINGDLRRSTPPHPPTWLAFVPWDSAPGRKLPSAFCHGSFSVRRCRPGRRGSPDRCDFSCGF